MTGSRQSAYDARRLAQGWRRVPVWLDAETQAALERLAGRGEVQEAIRRAIREAAGGCEAEPG